MTREEKTTIINSLAEQLKAYPHFYITDISELNAEQTAKLRRMCFEQKISLIMVKNTLFEKALEQHGETDAQLAGVLKGSSSIMFSQVAKAPAVLIKKFRETGPKPLLKAAYVQECVYVGDQLLNELVNIKSKEELIGDIVMLLQSPAKNVISALQGSAGQKVAGVVKALEQRGA